MKRLRTILRLTSQAAGTFCLAAGFATAGQWGFVAAAAVIFLGCILDFKWPSSWLPPAALTASVGLCVVGVYSGAQVPLMLAAATFALATWDLALLEHALAENEPSATTEMLERRHYQNLGMIAGFGLLVAIIAQVFQVSIPFVIMLALAAVLLFSLLRMWRMFTL